MKLLVLCALLVGASCASPGPEAEPRPPRITGPITAVRMEDGLVTMFAVARGAREYPVLIDPGRDYGFALSHLEEHRTIGDPVVVELVWRGGDAYATSILDA